MDDDRKVFSILLGVGNIILLTILSTLIVKIFGEEFIVVNILKVIFISLISNIVINILIYRKLYLDTELNEAVLYSVLTSVSWFIMLFIIIEFVGFNFDDPNIVLKIIVLIEYIINCFSMFLLNIIFIIGAFKYDKKKMSLFIGIVIQILIPILFIIFCNIISSAFYLNIYTEKEILNIMDKKEGVSNGEVIEIIDSDISLECEPACMIKIDKYIFALDDLYIRSLKGSKIYKIKGKNKIYVVGVYISSSTIIPKRQYKILDEYFI